MSLQTSESQNSATGCIYANAYDDTAQGRKLPSGKLYVGNANGHDWLASDDDFTLWRVRFENWKVQYSLENMPRARVETLSNGAAATFSSVGSYPILYLDSKDCVLCPDCALESERSGEPMAGGGVNYGDPTYCDECNAEIETAYPEEDEWSLGIEEDFPEALEL